MDKIKHFKTNVLLKSIIGKELINDDNIAILELVKNSYDANSKEVKVIFKNLKSNDDTINKTSYSAKSSKIVIQDFGVGMNEDDLENKWLNIAYSEKKTKKIEFERVLAGAKGVGRFSCDRLGEYLNIYTRKNGGEILHLYVDWKSFEIENRQDLEIQKIDVELKSITEKDFTQKTGFETFEKGTILEISKLRSKWAVQEISNKNIVTWNVERILDLKKSLEKLINPNQAFNKTSFSISLKADEFKFQDTKEQEHRKINVTIENKIFERLDYTSTSVSSSIDDTGKIITTTITDKGRKIFVLKEKNISFPLLKNVTIVLYYLNTYSKIYFTKQTGIRSVDFGSVYLFINGFRIPPYGEFGDDWLGLEIRKGQGYARFLGTRELIGRIEIKDEHNQFQIVSSREGLVKDNNYSQLTEPKTGFFYYSLKRLEKYVVEGLDWDRLSKKAKKEPEQREEGDDPNLKKYLQEFEKKVNSKTWKFNPKDEKYFENQQTKNKRILSIIDYIIDVRPENILSLYINEQLISELVIEEKDKAYSEFQKIITDISNLSEEQVSTLIEKIEKSKSTLESSLGNLQRLPNNKIDEETSKAFRSSVTALTKVDTDVDQNKIIINRLIQQKLEAEKKQNEEREAREKAEEDKRKLEENLALEIEKNTYLKATTRGLNEDAKGLVHNIKHTSKNIKSSVDSLLAAIKNGVYKEKDFFEKLRVIKFNNEKILKISKIVTRANFKVDENFQTIDLVKYTKQYLSIYDEIFDKSKISIEFKDNNVVFEKRFSALDFSLVLDDLISNSEKAVSQKILFEVIALSKEKIKITINDSGNGVSKRFSDNPESMFELGITDTDGSGIGLHSVRKSLKSMQGEIKFIGNNKILSGATFEIVISKNGQ